MKGTVYDSFEPIAPEWDDLFHADPGATPFTSPGWARAWSRSWAGSGQPWVIAVREEGELAGLAPFVMRRRGPFRVLSQLGNHPQRDVLARQDGVAAAEAVASEIARRGRDWDLVAINCFPGASRLAEALRAVGLRSRRRRTARYPGIVLPGSFDDYLASLPRKRRSDLRRHLRRVDEGVIDIRKVREPSAIAAAVDRWQALKVSWWDERGAKIHADQRAPRFADFLSDLMSLLVPGGTGEIWEFRHSGEVVGVEISLLDRRTFYSWEGGYHPDIAHLGPGKLAIGEGIRAAIASGRRYFDLMRGGQDYKYWFGATDRSAESLVFANDRPQSRAALAATTLLERLRSRRAARASEEGSDLR
jgi:CelD/BcsL family acetyltransferase involved in cellulose biosynthesis